MLTADAAFALRCHLQYHLHVLRVSVPEAQPVPDQRWGMQNKGRELQLSQIGPDFQRNGFSASALLAEEATGKNNLLLGIGKNGGRMIINRTHVQAVSWGPDSFLPKSAPHPPSPPIPHPPPPPPSLLYCPAALGSVVRRQMQAPLRCTKKPVGVPRTQASPRLSTLFQQEFSSAKFKV